MATRAKSAARRLTELFMEQYQQGAFSAGQLVVRRGHLLFELCLGDLADTARGTQGAEGVTSVSPETRFQVISASKPVVAAAIALLDEQGLVDVTRPISEIWPVFGAHGKHEILAEIVRRITHMPLPEFVQKRFPSELACLEFMRAPGETAAFAPTHWRGPPRLVIGGIDIAPRFEEINNTLSGVSALVPGAGMFSNARTLALFYETLARGGSLPSGQKWLSRATVERYTRRVSTHWDRSLRSFVPLGRGFGRGWLGPHIFGFWNTGSCFGHAGGFSVVAFGDERFESGAAIVTDTNRSLSALLRRFAPLGSAITHLLRTEIAAVRSPANTSSIQ